ncbi:MAG TPA: YggT family protein [Candidatus Eisenbacteria bacterium]|nr:YggT family protein [Candidatus Eisenbacteria bacterium]
MSDPLPPVRDRVTGELVPRRLRAPQLRPVYRVSVPAYLRMIQLIWFVVGVVDVLVGLRFLLKLFGASIASPFVALVYGLTGPLVAPFRNIFPVSGQGVYVFEPASLVAAAIYPLIGLGAVSLIRILSRRRTVAA